MAFSRKMAKILDLPYFLFSVFFFYWSIPIGSILYRIKFADLGSKKRNDMHDWYDIYLMNILKHIDAQDTMHSSIPEGHARTLNLPCTVRPAHRGKLMCDFFAVKVVKHGKQPLLKGRRCLYLVCLYLINLRIGGVDRRRVPDFR